MGGSKDEGKKLATSKSLLGSIDVVKLLLSNFRQPLTLSASELWESNPGLLSVEVSHAIKSPWGQNFKQFGGKAEPEFSKS